MVYSQVGSCGEQPAGAKTGSGAGDNQEMIGRNNKYNGDIKNTLEKTNPLLSQPSTTRLYNCAVLEAHVYNKV